MAKPRFFLFLATLVLIASASAHAYEMSMPATTVQTAREEAIHPEGSVGQMESWLGPAAGRCSIAREWEDHSTSLTLREQGALELGWRKERPLYPCWRYPITPIYCDVTAKKRGIDAPDRSFASFLRKRLDKLG